jgi:hypothetical protein
MPACEQGVVFHEFGGFSHGSPKVVGVIAAGTVMRRFPLGGSVLVQIPTMRTSDVVIW